MRESVQVQTRVAPSPLLWARDVASLAKPRLSALVVCTAAGGMWLAPGALTAARAVVLLVGTALVVGAANALNNFLERDLDARMRRTRNRPLPAGRLEPGVALALGLALPAFAIPALAVAVNPLTALLALVALVSYAGVYTPLKRKTTAALFVGAVPGAIPPLMGWTAVTGRIDWGGLALFGILFFWQLPHFLAISVYLKEDYARAGLKVFALVHGERAARAWAAVASLLLVPVTLSLVPLGLAGPAYGAAAAALGLGLAGWALAGLRLPEGSVRQARRFFLGTLVHLTLLFVALFLWAR
jgi:protoheme IX farnesyltransferase